MDISICIPLYNAEKFIKKTINSVLNQTKKDFELLIVNDCSTDSSLEIVNSFKDDRIRILQNDHNLGMHKTMNRCIEEASGKYILILCNDDLITEDCLSQKFSIMEKYENVNLVFSASAIINENDETIMERYPFKQSQYFVGRKIAKRSFETKNVFAEPSNVLIRKSAAIKAGGFDEKIKYSIDWEYWLRLCSMGDAFYINRVLSKFRISDSSMTTQLMKRRKIIFAEDKYFSEKCKRNPDLKFSQFTICRHYISTRFRHYGKEIFFLLRRIRHK